MCACSSQSWKPCQSGVAGGGRWWVLVGCGMCLLIQGGGVCWIGMRNLVLRGGSRCRFRCPGGCCSISCGSLLIGAYVVLSVPSADSLSELLVDSSMTMGSSKVSPCASTSISARGGWLRHWPRAWLWLVVWLRVVPRVR